jgi:hypothetical protein
MRGFGRRSGLSDAENPVRSRVVERDRALVVDHQPTGLGEDRVSKIVLRADRARRSQSGVPPICRAFRSPVADLVPRSARPCGRFRRFQMAATQRVQLGLECVWNMSPTIDMPLDHWDILPKIGVTELSHPAASAPESRENDLHCRATPNAFLPTARPSRRRSLTFSVPFGDSMAVEGSCQADERSPGLDSVAPEIRKR